jgi:AraC-like DNA-binding protein
MQFEITTDGVPERDRLEAWRSAIFGTLAISAEPMQGAERPYEGRFSARSSGKLLNCSFESDGFLATRKSWEIAYRRWDGYRVYRESSPGVRFKIGGEELVTFAGDLIVADADAPFEALPVLGYKDESWLLPKAMVDPYLPKSARRPVTRLSGRTGVDALAANYLETLTRNWDAIGEAGMGPVADTLARLIGIACGLAAEEQPDAVRAGRLTEARQYIDQHLTDPDLSPATVAAALRISVRSLHLLFEQSGGSFSRTMVRRRLEECRAALLANPTRPVTDVAYAWGFNSLSAFYRAFNAAFGMSPGDLRAMSRVTHGS